MELRHLRYFVAVADAGRVGHAARRLRLSQQALSKQLADLERELGVALFVRRPRGMALTRAGEEFLAYARDALAANTRAVEQARGMGRGGARLAVAGVELGFRNGLVPACVRAYHEEFPDARVPVRLLPSLAQWAAVADGEVDVGVVYTAPSPDHPELATEWLLDDPLSTAIIPAGHPVGRLGRRSAAGPEVPIGTLAGIPLLLPPRDRNPLYYDRLHAAFDAAGFAPSSVRESSGGPAAWALVAEGVGWVLEPASYLAAPPPGTAAVRLRDFALPFGLWLLWRRTGTPPAVRTFLDIVRTEARRLDTTSGRTPTRHAADAPGRRPHQAAARKRLVR